MSKGEGSVVTSMPTCDVRDEKDGRGDVKLVLCHVQVFCEPSELCGSDIGSIQERKSEENAVIRKR